MSPKKITQLGLIIAIASVAAMLASIVFWASWSWWPVAGLGVAILLFAGSYFRGAYIAAQQRADLIDKLNDCYTGKTENP